jgi:hypothetical protein
MWSADVESVTGGRVRCYRVRRGDAPITFGDALRCWEGDRGFTAFFLGVLADAPFGAFRWETPALTAATLRRPFEFVLLESPGLDRSPDPDAFDDHFRSAPRGATVVTFPNLRGDATLVVPLPLTRPEAYVHLAGFVRAAPEAQRHDLWRAVGAAMRERVGDRPVWLSTAGAGVAWLHVRLDDRPKYYGHRPYAAVRAP